MLAELTRWLVADVLKIDEASRLGQSVSFFVADSIAILALLVLITLLMGAVRYVLPVEKLRDFLAKHNLFGFDYLLAAVFGAMTPFCSCSSIPLFIGFLGAGIPLGVTLAFLITSPLINEVAVALMVGLFGWKVTAVYVVSGLLVGVSGGYIISRLKMERHVAAFVMGGKAFGALEGPSGQLFSRQAGREIVREAWGIIKQVTPYLLLGVALGAVIHGFVPQGFFESYLGKRNVLAVPAAVAVGVPFYASAHSVVPILQPLVDKGVPLGTALAFMMATVGLSLPEMLILKKVMRWPLLAAFFGVAALGMVMIGYVLNAVLPG